MRRVVVILLAAALFAPGSAHAAGCAEKRSHTAASTRTVRVYWTYVQSDNADELFGCVRKTGVTRKLFLATRAIGNYDSGIQHLRVNRYHVAFSSFGFSTLGQRGPSAAVHEVELRSGRHRSVNARDYDSRETGVVVDGLVLDRCGRVAYRAVLYDSYRDDEDRDPRLFTWIRSKRHLIDRHGAERGSFHFTGDSLRWVRGGAEHLTTVKPSC